MIEQWVRCAGDWINLGTVVRVVPLPSGCRVQFVDGSSELLSGKAVKELLRAISKGDD